MSEEALLAMKGIYKHFGGAVALENVDFACGYGEIVGLVGDNGAGKSTLIKIISGVYQPDEGNIFFDGKEIAIESPTDAKELGIETVHQDRGLVDIFDVSSNMFLGREPTKYMLLDKRKMEKESQKILESLGIEVESPRYIVRDLSGGQQQAVCVGRAVYMNPKVALMDEPTAALGVKEVSKVLDLMMRLRERGISVVFISHVLQEVFEVADRMVILRRGKKVGDMPTDETDKDEVVKLMVGTW